MANKQKQKQSGSSHSLATRILAIILMIMVTGSAITFIGWLILNLFS